MSRRSLRSSVDWVHSPLCGWREMCPMVASVKSAGFHHTGRFTEAGSWMIDCGGRFWWLRNRWRSRKKIGWRLEAGGWRIHIECCVFCLFSTINLRPSIFDLFNMRSGEEERLYLHPSPIADERPGVPATRPADHQPLNKRPFKIDSSQLLLGPSFTAGLAEQNTHSKLNPVDGVSRCDRSSRFLEKPRKRGSEHHFITITTRYQWRAYEFHPHIA